MTLPPDAAVHYTISSEPGDRGAMVKALADLLIGIRQQREAELFGSQAVDATSEAATEAEGEPRDY